MRKFTASTGNEPHLVLQAARAVVPRFVKTPPARLKLLRLRKTVPCRFNGPQSFPGRAPLLLWTILGSVPVTVNGQKVKGNLRGSTVTSETLRKLGLVPAPVIA